MALLQLWGCEWPGSTSAGGGSDSEYLSSLLDKSHLRHLAPALASNTSVLLSPSVVTQPRPSDMWHLPAAVLGSADLLGVYLTPL